MQASPDNIPCVYFSASDEGFIIDVNSTLCDIIGYRGEELVGQKIELIFTLATRIFQQTHFYPLLRMQGHAEEIYITLQHKDGTEVPILMNAKLSEATYHFAGIPVTKRKKFEEEIIAAKKAAEKALHENTDLKTAKEELQKHAEELDKQNLLGKQQNLELRQINHLTTHSLQEPVRKLIIFSGMLSDTDDESKVRLYAQKMRKSAEELNDKINGLQQFIKLTSDKWNFVDVDLEQVLKNIQLEIANENPGISIIIKSEPLPVVEANAEQMQFMLKELVTNAVKFRKPAEVVDVQIEASTLLLNKFSQLPGKYKYTEFVKLQIRDNGVGFNDEYQKQAFDLFRKLHPDSGRGIGLSLCKKIVENHAGTISISSKEGEGATIIILLPLRQGGNDEVI
ncbi:MAG TPA: ATP-binding protein [Saprospiraceae bacterium]|nr:ATP-binding protein [Saprospiraceae bacterium]